TRDAVAEYVAGVMQSVRPVALAIYSAAAGDLPLTTIGITDKVGEARALAIEYLDSLKPLLEDAARPKVAHDIKSVLLELQRRGVEPAGFEHDVMLYAFLLNAEPAGCSPEVLAEKYLDRKLGAAAEQQADCALTLAERMIPD